MCLFEARNNGTACKNGPKYTKKGRADSLSFGIIDSPVYEQFPLLLEDLFSAAKKI